MGVGVHGLRGLWVQWFTESYTLGGYLYPEAMHAVTGEPAKFRTARRAATSQLEDGLVCSVQGDSGLGF